LRTAHARVLGVWGMALGVARELRSRVLGGKTVGLALGFL